MASGGWPDGRTLCSVPTAGSAPCCLGLGSLLPACLLGPDSRLLSRDRCPPVLAPLVPALLFPRPSGSSLTRLALASRGPRAVQTFVLLFRWLFFLPRGTGLLQSALWLVSTESLGRWLPKGRCSAAPWGHMSCRPIRETFPRIVQTQEKLQSHILLSHTLFLLSTSVILSSCLEARKWFCMCARPLRRPGENTVALFWLGGGSLCRGPVPPRLPGLSVHRESHRCRFAPAWAPLEQTHVRP